MPREALLAAVQQRASELGSCTAPPGTASRLPSRIVVRRDGSVQSVEFTSEPPPAPLAECVRRTVSAWRFHEMDLRSDIDVLVTFRLGP